MIKCGTLESVTPRPCSPFSLKKDILEWRKFPRASFTNQLMTILTVRESRTVFAASTGGVLVQPLLATYGERRPNHRGNEKSSKRSEQLQNGGSMCQQLNEA